MRCRFEENYRMSKETEFQSKETGSHSKEMDRDRKKSKISYTRDYLLKLAELDFSKKVPSDFDLSILSSGIIGNGAGGSSGRQDIHKSILGNCKSTSNHDADILHADSQKHYANHSRYSWKNHGRDGILGSCALLKNSGGVDVPASKFHETVPLLNRSSQPYRPPCFHKALTHSGRESNDSFNNETFGSAYLCDQERLEEERRKASFEWNGKGQQKAIQENQKLIPDNQKENFDPDTCILSDKSVNVMGLMTKGIELADCRPQPVLIEDKSLPTVFTAASRSLVPTSFTSGMMETNLGSNALTHLPAAQLHSIIWDDRDTFRSHCSKFAQWFVDEENRADGGFLSHGGNTGSQVSGVRGGMLMEQSIQGLPAKSQTTCKPPMSMSATPTENVSDLHYVSERPVRNYRDSTNGDIGQSLPPENSRARESQHCFRIGWNATYKESEHQTCSNNDSASQYLLSMFQRKGRLKYLPSSKQIVENSDEIHSAEVENNMYMQQILRERSITERNLFPSAELGTGLMVELQALQASVSAQKGSKSKVKKADILGPCSFLEMSHDSHHGQQSRWRKIVRSQSDWPYAPKQGFGSQNVEELIFTPISFFGGKADLIADIQLPEEDSLITVDDTVIYQPYTPKWSYTTHKLTGWGEVNQGLNGQRYYPSYDQSRMKPWRTFCTTSDSQAHERNALAFRGMIDQNPSFHFQSLRNIPSYLCEQTPAELSRFERAVHDSLSQRTPHTGNLPPHLVNALPNDPLIDGHINQIPSLKEFPGLIPNCPLGCQRKLNATMSGANPERLFWQRDKSGCIQ
ncbi:hypothetical protein Ancab_009791 [Ancistrocladus abbreviatus]